MIDQEGSGQYVKPDEPPYFGLCNFVANADPAVTDDAEDGYGYHSIWYKVTNPTKLWICTDPTIGAAIWKEIALVGNVGGPVSCLASETLTAGNLIHLHLSASVIKARQADATDNTRPAHGFVLISANTGETATIYTSEGLVVTGLSGLTIGATYYLSETAGGVTSTAPTGTGKIVQQVGIALTATTLLFKPLTAIELA